MEPEETHLGHKIGKEGIQSLQDNVDSITNARAAAPMNVSKLKS